MPVTTCVFDAYGTLFDVAAAARLAAEEPKFPALAKTWPQLAEHWRAKQLNYSWLRAVMGAHTDFWTVTQDALDWSLEKTGLEGDAALRQRLLDLYWELQAYPEVPAMLKTLKAAGLNTAILSNGAPAMLDGAASTARRPFARVSPRCVPWRHRRRTRSAMQRIYAHASTWSPASTSTDLPTRVTPSRRRSRLSRQPALPLPALQPD